MGPRKPFECVFRGHSDSSFKPLAAAFRPEKQEELLAVDRCKIGRLFLTNDTIWLYCQA